MARPDLVVSGRTYRKFPTFQTRSDVAVADQAVPHYGRELDVARWHSSGLYRLGSPCVLLRFGLTVGS